MSLLRGPAVLECTRGGDSRAPTVAARRTQDWLLSSCSTRWPISLLCRSSRFISPLWRRVSLHGPNCSFDHGHSPVAQHGDRCPCCTGRAGFLVSDSLLFGVRCSPVEYQTTDFPGSLLQEMFTYSALSGLTVDTCWLQSTRPLEEFHTFHT